MISLMDVKPPKQIYEDLFSQFPPNPLLPKSFNAGGDSPRSGGVMKFLKLTKFRGIDHGRSKFRQEAAKIEKINFPESVTMKKVFKVLGLDDDGNKEAAPTEKPSKKDKAKQAEEVKVLPPPAQEKDKNEPLMTAFGELVYMRNTNKDFVSKQKML